MQNRLSLMIVFGTLLSFALMGLSGCAYSMGTGERRLPEGYQMIAVPVFKNSTQEVGVEVPFTNAIIRELERAQIGRVVERNQAQVVLEGEIKRIDYEIVSQATCTGRTDAECLATLPRNTILNTEYRILMMAKLQVRRVSDSAVLWSEEFNSQKSYLAPKIGLEGLNSANALYNHSARQENLNAMAVDMMAEAHGRLTENF